MSKRTIFIGIVMMSILCYSTVIFAEQYYDQYPGNSFLPLNESVSYYRDNFYGYIYHNDTSDADYNFPVTFNVPDGAVYFIKSIGIRYFDNLTNGYISAYLVRENLYTGAVHTVAAWTSGLAGTTVGVETASKGTETGKKLIDTKKFVYWLNIFFMVSGEVNPGIELKLYQVRIHYGT